MVVGLGPVGAVAACLLGQAGLRTLVVERTEAVWDKPRAIAIDHEIMRLLQNIGVAEAVLPFTAPFTASEHFGAAGQLIRRVDMVPEPYPQGYVPSMVFTQPSMEAALRAHLGTFPSVAVRLGVAFTGLTQSADGVIVALDDGSDVHAAYVIAADGASSPVRKQVGIAFEDLVFDEPWMVIDVLVNEGGLCKLPHTSAQFCEPARPATFIVGPGHHRRFEIMLLPGEDPRAMEAPDRVWALLSRWIGPSDGTLWRASSYRFHALVAERWRAGRVFLAGDAAHQQPPFIGQGMCQGMRDAGNLIWKLIAVLRHEAGDALLDSYGAERGLHVRTLTARIKAIGHSICERDPLAAAARDARLIAEGGGRAPVVTRQEIVPPLQTGFLAEGADAARGTLFPQPWVLTPGGATRMDDVIGCGWRLVVDGRHGRVDSASVPIVTIGPDALPERDGIAAAWFERHACVAALIRPDHYVFGIAPTFSAVRGLLHSAGV